MIGDTLLREVPTNFLINFLSTPGNEENQYMINRCAYELACRTYVPGKGVEFDDLLKNFGYQFDDIKEENNKTLIKKR